MEIISFDPTAKVIMCSAVAQGNVVHEALDQSFTGKLKERKTNKGTPATRIKYILEIG